MNVPPLHKLIVCVIPPQTIVRQCVLAAVSYVSVLCGAANAQLAPAAPPLTLWNAVELSHGTQAGKTYVLEQSSDLSLWTAVGPEVYGSGEETVQFLAAGPAPEGFYRLKVNTLPEAGKSRWSMTGCRMVFNSAAGPCSMAFGEGNTGTMTGGETITAFTWDWKRTGADDGRVIVSWPDGAVETMHMQFVGANSGAFTSQRMVDGIPASASSGTFRDESGALLAEPPPASIRNTLVTFAGTGRPLGVEVSADGTAVVPGPAGTRAFLSSYTVTGAEATLVLTNNYGISETWVLHFTGPRCGTYTGTSMRGTVLRRTSAGSFTLAPR